MQTLLSRAEAITEKTSEPIPMRALGTRICFVFYPSLCIILSVLSFLPLLCLASRAGPSGADPTALVGQQINHEEDVLHVRTLPSFENRISQGSSELLVTYLTAPYLRIPLLLNYFASPEHIRLLGVRRLQVSREEEERGQEGAESRERGEECVHWWVSL